MIKAIQLITPATYVGHGANDGVYYPTGLLTIASQIEKIFTNIKIYIDDQNVSEIKIRDNTQIVGISIPSPLCYQNVLNFANTAKKLGKIVVVGEPYATVMHKLIMRNQPSIKYVIRGKGENAFVELILNNNHLNYENILGLSYRDGKKIVHNPNNDQPWSYDSFTPLPLHLLTFGIKKYWNNFNIAYKTKNTKFFQIFTHFGCTWQKIAEQKRCKKQFPYCSFCALQDEVSERDPESIITEIKQYIETYHIPKGTTIVLKDYGDNIGGHKELLSELNNEIKKHSWWNHYNFNWIMYCQSNYLTEETAKLLNQIRCSHLFIGFDSVNNKLQKLNGLGTNRKSHERAIDLCRRYNIKIQAASVVGIAGETPETLEETFQFFKKICLTNIVERVNSAIFFLVPGSLAWKILAKKVPEINNKDLFSTTELRGLWIKYFCPQVNLEILHKYAIKLDSLSSGAHTNMGYKNKEKNMSDQQYCPNCNEYYLGFHTSEDCLIHIRYTKLIKKEKTVKREIEKLIKKYHNEILTRTENKEQKTFTESAQDIYIRHYPNATKTELNKLIKDTQNKLLKSQKNKEKNNEQNSHYQDSC